MQEFACSWTQEASHYQTFCSVSCDREVAWALLAVRGLSYMQQPAPLPRMGQLRGRVWTRGQDQAVTVSGSVCHVLSVTPTRLSRELLKIALDSPSLRPKECN